MLNRRNVSLENEGVVRPDRGEKVERNRSLVKDYLKVDEYGIPEYTIKKNTQEDRPSLEKKYGISREAIYQILRRYSSEYK